MIMRGGHYRHSKFLWQRYKNCIGPLGRYLCRQSNLLFIYEVSRVESINFECLAIQVAIAILVVFLFVFVIDSGFEVEETSNCGWELIFLLMNRISVDESLTFDVHDSSLCFVFYLREESALIHLFKTCFIVR